MHAALTLLVITARVDDMIWEQNLDERECRNSGNYLKEVDIIIRSVLPRP